LTTVLAGDIIAQRVEDSIPGAVEESTSRDLWVKPETILEVCRFLNGDSALRFDYLVSISAVDYIEYFEMVYHLLSMPNNHSLVLKAKCWGREDLTVPSITSLWQGADFQEREVYDLMGISFSGHYNMKRIMLWEGFPGHPQRKDYLESPR
jgi:NADH-quinone oxidoreductase subunit C